MAEYIGYVTGTPATLDRNIADRVWDGGEGIGGAYDLRVSAGAGMSVNVGSGRAVIDSEVTWEGKYVGLLTATKNLVLAAAHATLYRTDAIVARGYDTYLGDGSTAFACEVVAGTPNAANPAPAPSIPARAIKIAEVRVNPLATTPSLVVDTRVLAAPKTLSMNLAAIGGTTSDCGAGSFADWTPMNFPVTRPLWAGSAVVTVDLSDIFVVTAASTYSIRIAADATLSTTFSFGVPVGSLNLILPPLVGHVLFPSLPGGLTNTWKIQAARTVGASGIARWDANSNGLMVIDFREEIG